MHSRQLGAVHQPMAIFQGTNVQNGGHHGSQAPYNMQQLQHMHMMSAPPGTRSMHGKKPIFTYKAGIVQNSNSQAQSFRGRPQLLEAVHAQTLAEGMSADVMHSSGSGGSNMSQVMSMAFPVGGQSRPGSSIRSQQQAALLSGGQPSGKPGNQPTTLRASAPSFVPGASRWETLLMNTTAIIVTYLPIHNFKIV